MKNSTSTHFIVSIFFLFLCFKLDAQDQIDGWFHNANEPGTGINVDKQANIVGIAFYEYRDNGENQWFLAAGGLQRNDSNNGDVFEAELQSYTGSCFECPHNPSEVTFTGEFIRIEFLDNPNAKGLTTANVTLRGKTEVFTRQVFGFQGPLGSLLGKWAFTELIEQGSDLFDVTTDVLLFDTIDEIEMSQAILLSGSVRTFDGAEVGATIVNDGGQFDGWALALALNIAGFDVAWLFKPAKENLAGFVAVVITGEGFPEDILLAGESTTEFTASRIGDSLVINSATEQSIENASSSTPHLPVNNSASEKTNSISNSITSREKTYLLQRLQSIRTGNAASAD